MKWTHKGINTYLALYAINTKWGLSQFLLDSSNWIWGGDAAAGPWTHHTGSYCVNRSRWNQAGSQLDENIVDPVDFHQNELHVACSILQSRDCYALARTLQRCLETTHLETCGIRGYGAVSARLCDLIANKLQTLAGHIWHTGLEFDMWPTL